MADGRDGLPAGMRNNNPANIKYLPTLPYAGIVGPSVNTDQGDPQAVFETPEAGMLAAYQLALKKYGAGKVTANQLVAGQGGWTPGNRQAAANIAAAMGLGPDDDLGLTDPASAHQFLRGLVTQEQGPAGDAYGDDMIASTVGGGLGAGMQPAAPPPADRRKAPGVSAQAAVAELLRRGIITPEQAAAKGYGAAAPSAADSVPSWFGELGRGFGSAVKQTPSDILSGAGAALGALGMPQTASSVESAADSIRPATDALAPTVPTMSDIHSLGDVGRYVFGAVGSGAGSTVAPILGGLAGAGVGAMASGVGAIPGGIIGAAGSSYLQNTGQLASDLREQGIDPKEARYWAAAFGAPMAALDVVGVGKALGIPRREVEKAVVQNLVGKIASGALKGAGAEGITETAQQALQETAGALAGGNRSTGQRLQNVLESGVQGALGGATLGAAAHRDHVAESAIEPEEQSAPSEAAPLALPPPDYKDPVIRPLMDEHNALAQRAAGMQERVEADPTDANAATSLQFLNQRMQALRDQISGLRSATLTPAPDVQAAAPVAPPMLALPNPGSVEPIAAPVVGQLQAVNARLAEMQQRVKADPTDAAAKQAAQFLTTRSTELQTQVDNLRNSAITPPPAAVPPASRPSITPDWTMPQTDEREMSVFDGDTDTGQRVYVRQDGTFRPPGQAPHSMADSPLAELPDRMPAPQEILDAAKPAAPVQNPQFVPLDEAQRRGEETARRQQEEQQRAAEQEQQAEAGEAINAQSPTNLGPTNSLSRTASWVIRDKETGEPVMETFDRKKVDALNTQKYEAVPILQHLQEINSNIKESSSQGTPQSTTEAPTAAPSPDVPFRRKAADDVEIARAAESAPQRALAEQRLQSVAGPLFGPQAKVRTADTITAPGEGAAQTSALGMYQAGDGSAPGIIHVAMKAHDQTVSGQEQDRTLYHEGIHHLRAMNAFTPREWKTLSAAAERDWIKRYDIDALYPGADQDTKVEEATAEAFADWQAGKATPMSARPIFAKIKTFFQRAANVARGMGFRTADDVLGSVSAGKVAARPAVRGRLEPTINFSKKAPPGTPPSTREANVSRGKQAMEHVLGTKTGAANAMYRPEFGWIDFPWQQKELGIRHAIEERMAKDNMRESQAQNLMRSLPDTIASGTLGSYYKSGNNLRRNLTSGGRTVVLQFVPSDTGNSWVATAFGGSKNIPLSGEKVSEQEARRIIAGASALGTKAQQTGLAPSSTVHTPGRSATQDGLQPDRTSGAHGTHTTSRGGTPPSSAALGAATGEDVSSEEQPVKPIPLGSKLRRTPFNQASKTARPSSIAEALHQADDERLGKVGEALGSALSKIKRGADARSVSRGLDAFRNAVQDNFIPVRRAQEAVARRRGRDITDRENVYQQQEFYSGRVADRSERLQREHVAPMLDAMTKAKISKDEIDQYLYARHAPERNARISAINPKFKPGEGSGITDMQAAKVMADIRQSGRTKDFERIAAMADAIKRQTQNGLVDDGLMSADQMQQWQKQYPNYVPLKGLEGENDMADVMPNTSGGFQVRGKESKMAAGRQSKASDVLENVIMQAQEGIVRGEKNRVVNALHEIVQNNPDADYWRIDPVATRPVFNKRTGLIEYRNQAEQEDAKTVWGKIAGKPVRIRLEDPRLLNSVKQLDAERMGAVIRSMAGVTRFLSGLNTSFSPEFVVSNAFRDVIQSQITGQRYDIPKFASQMRKNYFKALKGAYGGLTGGDRTEFEKLFQQYSKLGGRVGFARIESLDDIRARMARELKSHGNGPWQMTKKRAFALADYIGRVNGAVDNAVRLAAFKTAIDSGMTPAQAASIGKNITVNFNRHGTVGPLANAFYMFFNAGVQGNQVLLSAIKGSRKVQRIIGAVVAAGAAQELANRMFGGKDDDGEDLYDKIGGNPDSSDFLKSTNAVFMIPGAGKDSWNYLRIPLPYGLNVFWNFGRNAAALAMGRQSVGRSIGSVASSAANAFNPIGGAENLLNMMAPTLMDPLVDIYINQNFTGAPVHPTDTDQTLPQSSKGQYWASASQPSVFMARSLNEITGGNDFKPGVVNVNPNDLDHAFGSYAGAAGGLLSRLWASGTRAVGMTDDPTVPVMGLNEVPFVRRIAGGTSASFDRSTFYERHDQLKIIENQIKGYAEAGDRDTVSAVRQQNRPLLPLIPMADQVQRDLSAVRKARSTLIENDKMSPDTRKARLDQLNQREQQILLRFNTRWVAANQQMDAA